MNFELARVSSILIRFEGTWAKFKYFKQIGKQSRLVISFKLMSNSRRNYKCSKKLTLVSLLHLKIISFSLQNLFEKISFASKSVNPLFDKFMNSKFYKSWLSIILEPWTLDKFRILKFLSEKSSCCRTIGWMFGWISVRFKAFTYSFSDKFTIVLIFWSNFPKLSKID